MSRATPMSVVLTAGQFRALGLDDPARMLRARAAFYIGLGLETVTLYVQGGVYAHVADEAVELAIWLGMTDQDVIQERK